MIWIIGNKGMLGQELECLFTKLGIQFMGTDREIDITSPESIDGFIQGLTDRKLNVEWIVNCAAYTAVDKAEDDSAVCRRINTDGPANIASVANRIGAKFIHISTDYVFNGNAHTPYSENDATDPIGVYGKTKRDGETAAIGNCGNTWIIRTSWLYGRFGNNFVHTMLRLMSERDALSVVSDQHGTPTYAPDLCGLISAIISEGSAVPPSIYHFSNLGETTWYDFALEIYRLGKMYGHITRECRINACSSADYPAKVTRPLYSVLDKTKVMQAIDFQIPEWQESLDVYLKEYVCAR